MDGALLTILRTAAILPSLDLSRKVVVAAVRLREQVEAKMAAAVVAAQELVPRMMVA